MPPQFGPCIKHKLLTALDRISEQPVMELFDGVRLVRDPGHSDGRSARSSDSTGATAPEDETAAAAAAGLDELVVNRIVDFFKSRSLQFKLLDNEPRLMADGKYLYFTRHFPTRLPLRRVKDINRAASSVSIFSPDRYRNPTSFNITTRLGH